MNFSETEDKRALSASAVASLLVHAVLIGVIVAWVHGTDILKLPPKPKKQVIQLTLQPPPPPPPPKKQPPPPKPPPKVPPIQTNPLPRPVMTQTQTPEPIAEIPPPPPPEPAPSKPAPPKAPPAPPSPQPGVVGYSVSSAYANLLRGKIQSALQYPIQAARQGREGTAQVRVLMKRDGTIEKVALVKRTGSLPLDKEAVAVFSRIHKFPPLPDSFMPTASEFQFELPITFRLR
jgi:TonB family C-terminal domain